MLLALAAAVSTLLVALHLWRHRWWPQLRERPWVARRLPRRWRADHSTRRPRLGQLLVAATRKLEAAVQPHPSCCSEWASSSAELDPAADFKIRAARSAGAVSVGDERGAGSGSLGHASSGQLSHAGSGAPASGDVAALQAKLAQLRASQVALEMQLRLASRGAGRRRPEPHSPLPPSRMAHCGSG